MQINYNLLSYLSSVISKAPLKLKVLIVLLTGFGFLFSPLMAHADYSAPSWWNGDQCDSTHYNNGNGHTPQLLITWSGIQTCGYGPNQNPYNWSDVSVTMPAATAADYEWECTELVKRYLYLAYSATALSSTNGDQVVANYASNYPSKFKSISNTTDSWHGFPNVGDVISYSDVHTAIITGVTVTDQTNGNATLNLVEQNASLSGTTTQQVIGWKIKGDIDDPNDTGTDTVTAWLTPLQWSNNSPSGTTHDAIQAMATSSTSNVWATGYESVANCGSNMPVTYHNDGTGWTKYQPSYSCGSNPYYLNGVATSSPSDAWVVGSYDPTGSYHATLAEHWTGSSWSKVTSDSPAPSGNNNDLFGVAYAGTDVFAAGWYYDGTAHLDKPLIEKWNGTKFAQQTVSVPTGVTHVKLNSVAFSSSTSGWAVGQGYNGSGWYDLFYQYNGTTWTGTLGSIASPSNLLSVSVLPSGEAWAVGYGSTPLIMHYTSGSWTQDTSFNGSFPTNTNLESVSADSTSDVWIAGYSGSGTPYTMHYNGSAWSQVSTPSVSGTSELFGVAVNSDVAWAGGFQNGTTNPNPLTFKSL